MVSKVESQFVVSSCSSLAQKLAMDVQSGEFAQMLAKWLWQPWFTISTGAVSKDSANMFVSFKNKEETAALLCTPKNPSHFSSWKCIAKLDQVIVVYIRSLAYATALCNGIDHTACFFDLEEMWPHFLKCIMGSRVLTPFPILKQQRSSPKPKKIEGVSIYCHCRLPYKPEEPMIQCGHCKES